MELLNNKFDFVTILNRDGKHGVTYHAFKKDGQDVVIKTIIKGSLHAPKTIDAMPTKFVVNGDKKDMEVCFIDHNDPLAPFIKYSIYKTCNKFHSFIMEYKTENAHCLDFVENLPRAIKMLEYKLEFCGYCQVTDLILTKLKDML